MESTQFDRLLTEVLEIKGTVGRLVGAVFDGLTTDAAQTRKTVEALAAIVEAHPKLCPFASWIADRPQYSVAVKELRARWVRRVATVLGAMGAGVAITVGILKLAGVM